MPFHILRRFGSRGDEKRGSGVPGFLAVNPPKVYTLNEKRPKSCITPESSDMSIWAPNSRLCSPRRLPVSVCLDGVAFRFRSVLAAARDKDITSKP